MDRAEEIIRLYQSGTRDPQIQAKIGKLLAETKKEVGHGNFKNWIDDNLPFHRRTCRRMLKRYKKIQS